MLDGFPNLAFALGDTNASWTLKVDLMSSVVARPLTHMRRTNAAVVTPRLPSTPMDTTPFIDTTSGYSERSRAKPPLQGDQGPWRLQQHSAKDAVLFLDPVTEEHLDFGTEIPAAV